MLITEQNSLGCLIVNRVGERCSVNESVVENQASSAGILRRTRPAGR
ncbi:MAG: hypothetical protein IPM40_04225 [Gammaproteobacteria bacterium]|nr:hypothetical protein [Gammaproteobacteria bacterium]